jgi:hypothetical protein
MKNILFLDIDNTLLIPQNIFIYYKKDNIYKKYTPQEYTKLEVHIKDKKYFDYHEFQDKEIIKNSILTSIPIKKSLDIVKEHIKNNYELGIITARGQEELVAKTIQDWLYKQIGVKFIMKRENIYAINDLKKKYTGLNDSEKKLNILKKYIKKYTKISFMEDNLNTINIIKQNLETLVRNQKINLIYVDWKN